MSWEDYAEPEHLKPARFMLSGAVLKRIAKLRFKIRGGRLLWLPRIKEPAPIGGLQWPVLMRPGAGFQTLAEGQAP